MGKVFKEAKWIWENDGDNLNEYINFFDFFTVGSPLDEIKLKISVDSNYELYINGEFVNFGQYADYPFNKVYDEIDITSFLKQGRNTLAILGYYHGVDASTYYKDKPGLIFEVTANGEVLLASSEQTLCRKAIDYMSGSMEEITGQIGFTYHYNALKYDGWNEKDYVVSDGWQNAVLVDFSCQLFQRPIEKLLIGNCSKGSIVSQGVFINDTNKTETTAYRMQHSYLAYKSMLSLTGVAPKQVLPFDNGISFSCDDGDGMFIIIDLEKEMVGGLTIDIEALEETLVEIGYGEHIDDLRVRTFIGGRNFALTYKCKKGRNRFSNYMRRLGCRYLQLHIHSINFVLYNVGIIPEYYPLTIKECTIKDKLHKKIYETCVETLRLCMHEHYEDTPWREQALYTMDSRNQMLCGYYAFEEYRFAKASLNLILLGKRDDGYLSLCSPGRHPLTIPCFSLVWFLQLYEYVEYSKDLDFAKYAYKEAKKILQNFLKNIDETGLIPELAEEGFWNFYEWTDELWGDDTPQVKRYSSILNGFLSIAVSSFSKICKLLQYKEDIEKYDEIYNRLNKAIHTYFWDENSTAYTTFMENGIKSHFAEFTQALIVYSGACPEQKIAQVLQNLTDDNSKLNKISLSHSIFKYDVLMQNDPQKYSEYVWDDISKIWGEMLFQNATSFWETSDGGWAFNNAGSLSHGWSAVPLYIYSKYNF